MAQRQGISKKVAYAFQAAFFSLGVLLSSQTYASPDAALLASSVGMLVQIATILWFCKTYRGYFGKPLVGGSVLLSLAIVIGGLYIHESRTLPKLTQHNDSSK